MRIILPGRLAAAAATACAAALPLPARGQAEPQAGEAAVAFEAAAGLMLGREADYPGAARDKLTLTPALYLRWGRFSLSTSGALVNRRREDVVRGLGTELYRGSHARVSLGLRLDMGRRSGDSDALAGIPDVRRTVRARLALNAAESGPWRAALGVSTDLLGRAGGALLDASLGQEWSIGHAQTLGWSLGGTWGSARAMSTWYGVTPEAAQASGYPVYDPGAGLRDANAGIFWRREIGERWIVLARLGRTRLAARAAASPYVFERDETSSSLGFARRF